MISVFFDRKISISVLSLYKVDRLMLNKFNRLSKDAKSEAQFKLVVEGNFVKHSIVTQSKYGI